MYMKKELPLAFLISVILILQIFFVSASVADLREEWLDSKLVSKEKQLAHREAKLAWQANQTPENNQAVIDTGKESLHAALDEVEAWLHWKKAEAQENPFASEEIKQNIDEDVETNLAKIDALREDVDGITNRFELGVVFLTMIGKYFELLTDVMRNSGQMWVHVANTRVDVLEEYEQKIRDAAEMIDNNEEMLERLDEAKDEIGSARTNLDLSKAAYDEVVIGGTPLIKFHEGNQKLREARTNMLTCGNRIREVFRMVMTQ